MPKAYIIARSAISYRRYITRSARNGYHWKKSPLSVDKSDFFLGTPSRNRTCNCPLGGGRYIHLTMRAYRVHFAWRGCSYERSECAFIIPQGTGDCQRCAAKYFLQTFFRQKVVFFGEWVYTGNVNFSKEFFYEAHCIFVGCIGNAVLPVRLR